MMTILIVLSVLVCYALGVGVGYILCRHRTVNYRQRWLDSVKTMKEMAMSPIPDHIMEEAGLQEPKPKVSSKWVLETIYDSDNYAYFYARKGSESVKLGHSYGYVNYPYAFQNDRDQVQRTVKQMNGDRV